MVRILRLCYGCSERKFLVLLCSYLIVLAVTLRLLRTGHFHKLLQEASLSRDRTYYTVRIRPVLTVEEPKEEKKCEIPQSINFGVPWPKCQQRFEALKWNITDDYCHINYDEDNRCNRLKYLSEIERSCPLTDLTSLEDRRLQSLYFKGENATCRQDFNDIYKQMQGILDYKWMRGRIQDMEKLWINAGKEFCATAPPLKKKRVHVHAGLLDWKLASGAGKGAPLGELLQWSDLISALHILGHDVVITRNKPEIRNQYHGVSLERNDVCLNVSRSFPFDIIYTDIIGYNDGLMKEIQEEILEKMKCKIRIVDTWGTEAMYNNHEYAEQKNIKDLTFYSGLDLDLRQFNTFYPHTPDNTFLGFVTEKLEKTPSTGFEKRDIALLYAKQESYLDNKYDYINIIKDYVSEVHSTIANRGSKLPFIINHGILPLKEMMKLLRRTKIFVGFGIPYEGPAALEAVQNGAVFLNRKIVNPQKKKNKPNTRLITSQNTYAERIGKPHVYTLDIDNATEVRAALSEIMNTTDPGDYLPLEYTAKGMLQRVGIQVEKQDFCISVPYNGEESGQWPPISALKATSFAETNENCNDACEKLELMCEPSFFPVVNRKEAFTHADVNTLCHNVVIAENPEIDYPAFDRTNNTCYLQTNPRLFSCAGNYMGMMRLCPCRDFIPEQSALCSDCLLT